MVLSPANGKYTIVQCIHRGGGNLLYTFIRSMMYFIDVMTSSVTVITPSTISLITLHGSSFIVVSRASHIVSGGGGGMILYTSC